MILPCRLIWVTAQATINIYTTKNALPVITVPRVFVLTEACLLVQVCLKAGIHAIGPPET